MATTLLDDKTQIITIKEVFERCIALETKLDMKTEIDKHTSKKFEKLAFFIVAVECINLFLNGSLIYFTWIWLRTQ